MKKLFKLFLTFIFILVIWALFKIDIKKFFSDSTPKKTELSIEDKARKIDTFFASTNSPLTGHGRDFVVISDKYGLDWRLMAAICRVESTSGRYFYKRDRENVLGYKTKKDIKSIEESIELSCRSFSGESSRTYMLYRNKTYSQRLFVYSGGEEGYASKVYSYMREIHTYEEEE